MVSPAGLRPQVELARVGAGDWRILRAARLMALQTSPEAFCGNYARERIASRRAWQQRSRTGDWTVARSGGQIVGLTGMLAEPDPVGGPDAPWGTRCIESVWVHPGLRRQGVVRQILGSLERRALGEGIGNLVLWVLESNRPAQEVYLRLGYRFTGLAQPISVCGGWDVERRMVKQLV